MSKKDTKSTSSADKARELLMQSINKKFGTNTLRKFTITEQINRISTSYFLLDDILGGGIPEGRIVEIYGWESVGKSFLTTKIMSSAQAQGKVVALFDAENAFHGDFAHQCGLDIEDKFIYSDEQSGNKIFGSIETICEANIRSIEEGNGPLVDVIVVDSVASLMTEYEEEHSGDGKSKIGDLAKMMAVNLKKLPKKAAAGKCTIIFINQVRQQIGVMYGNPEITPGGKALGFFASVRIELRRKGGTEGKILEGKDNQVGHKVVAKIVKNKTAPPHRKAEFTIFYDGRTDDTEDILAMGEKYEFIQVQGNTRRYVTDDGVEIKAVGKAKMLEAIREGGHALREEMIAKIKEHMKKDGNLVLSNDEIEESNAISGSWSENEDEEFNLDDLDNFNDD